MSVMPQEIEVWYVLPAIRRELSKEMIKLGMTQRKVAALLKVTEATISQYLKSKRAKEIKFDQKILNEIKASASRIVEEESQILDEIQRICELIKKTNLLCKIHRKYDKDVLAKCKACLAGLK